MPAGSWGPTAPDCDLCVTLAHVSQSVGFCDTETLPLADFPAMLRIVLSVKVCVRYNLRFFTSC